MMPPEAPVQGSEHWSGLLWAVVPHAAPQGTRPRYVCPAHGKEWAERAGYTVTRTHRLWGDCEHAADLAQLAGIPRG